MRQSSKGNIMAKKKNVNHLSDYHQCIEDYKGCSTKYLLALLLEGDIPIWTGHAIVYLLLDRIYDER